MNRLTHIDENASARMVDIGGKSESKRQAVAEGRIEIDPQALAAIRAGNAPKGDVIGPARLAGIMAAKKTSDLVPLCHPVILDTVDIEFVFEDDGIRATSTASLTGRTGVEMEALTAVTVALLTIYDMGKAIDRSMTIGEIRLLAKQGGKSGEWRRER